MAVDQLSELLARQFSADISNIINYFFGGSVLSKPSGTIKV
jgi:hypothetical protein